VKIHFIKFLVAFTSLFCTCSGCGLIFGGSKIGATAVVKDHPNAQVYVNGKMAEQGKVAGVYPRRNPVTVEVKQDGCEPKTQTFGTTFRTGNFLLNVLWVLPPVIIVGMLADLTTGACYKPDHKRNAAIKKDYDTNFTFTVDYPGCPSNR
jgi:hypothetical protein